MINVMKIIQTIKMKVTTQQTNTSLKSIIIKSFDVFMVVFEHISHLALVLVMSISNM